MCVCVCVCKSNTTNLLIFGQIDCLFLLAFKVIHLMLTAMILSSKNMNCCQLKHTEYF